MDASISSSDDDGSSTSSLHSASSSTSDSAPSSPLPVTQSHPTTPPADARMEGIGAAGSDDEQLPPRVPVSGTRELFAFFLFRRQATVAKGAEKIVCRSSTPNSLGLPARRGMPRLYRLCLRFGRRLLPACGRHGH